MLPRRYLVALGILAVVALAGCGDDGHRYDDVRPYMQPGSGPQPVAAAPAEVEAMADPAKPKEADTSSDMPPDPLVGEDSLADDADTLGSDADDAKTDDTPPPDPLASTSVPMPTQHSHWLRGAISDALVSVSLNYVKMGDYYTTIDKDITMSCRKGENTITFTYTPFDTSSFATIDVLESEHTPPIAPLATFDSTVDAMPDATGINAGGSTPKSVTKTYEFVAN